jgi:hypothetical protein
MDRNNKNNCRSHLWLFSAMKQTFLLFILSFSLSICLLPVGSKNMSVGTPLSPKFIDSLITNVFRVYTTRSYQEQREIFGQYFSRNVLFEDPLMRVQGEDFYRVQFLSLIKLFSEVTVSPWMRGGDGDEGRSSDNGFRYSLRQPGALGEETVDVIVPNVQVYKWTSNPSRHRIFPAETELKVVTTITINTKDQRIVRHEDVWPESNAFQNRFYRQHVKSIVGSVVSSWLLFIGW